MYKAILLKDKESNPSISSISIDDLPEGNVTVRIDYSTINYKDSLALVNKIPIIRKFPMVPGIDFVGTVIETDSLDYSKNQKVILNGWGVGESHWGGLSQIARVSSNWLIPLPKNLSPKQAMTVGTAGYTAMLCVMKLEKHGIHPADGKVLVTGATGGVGRVTENLLNGIIDTLDLKKEFDFLPLEKKKKFEAFDLSCVDTYFFSSIHWCTDPLPKNSVIMIMDVIPLIFSDLFPKAVVKKRSFIQS